MADVLCCGKNGGVEVGKFPVAFFEGAAGTAADGGDTFPVEGEGGWCAVRLQMQIGRKGEHIAARTAERKPLYD